MSPPGYMLLHVGVKKTKLLRSHYVFRYLILSGFPALAPWWPGALLTNMLWPGLRHMIGHTTFAKALPYFWNNLPEDVRQCSSLSQLLFYSFIHRLIDRSIDLQNRSLGASF